jgi:hypothetical protein
VGLLQAVYDPLQTNIDLPLNGVFFPLGFRVEIASNSRRVLEAAEESFGGFENEFAGRTIRLRIAVNRGPAALWPPVVRGQGRLFSAVCDRENFALYDSASMFGYSFVSERTVTDQGRFRFHFLEAMCYMLLAQEATVPVHAGCVALGGSGILLCGRSGAGKSTLAWACARAGWTYVADDGASLVPDAGERTVAGKYRHVRLREDVRCLFPELAEYAVETCANGKRALEVPLKAFPHMRAGPRATVEAVVALDHRASTRARLEPMPAREAADLLLADSPWYGEDVSVRHQRAVARLLESPAFRLTYTGLDQAVAALTGLAGA